MFKSIKNMWERIKSNLERKKSFMKKITPKNTEELRPGLFIQKYGKNYRQIYPAAWNGKINSYNFLLGHGFLKRTFFILLVLFLAWAYSHDTGAYKDFYENVNSDLQGFCYNASMAGYGQGNTGYGQGSTLPELIIINPGNET